MAECCEAAAAASRLMPRPTGGGSSEMFVMVDDDDFDVPVTRSMSFRRCAAVRPVRGGRHRRSCRPTADRGVTVPPTTPASHCHADGKRLFTAVQLD